jgi:hypothetical protein
MRKSLYLAFILLFIQSIRLYAQKKDTVAVKAIALRNEFVEKVKGSGFTPSLARPEIVFDNPRSYGNYDADSNILHTSDWSVSTPYNLDSFLKVV